MSPVGSPRVKSRNDELSKFDSVYQASADFPSALPTLPTGMWKEKIPVTVGLVCG